MQPHLPLAGAGFDDFEKRSARALMGHQQISLERREPHLVGTASFDQGLSAVTEFVNPEVGQRVHVRLAVEK